MKILRGGSIIAIAALSACGGSDGFECGDGTIEVDGVCVPIDTGNECAPGTVDDGAGNCIVDPNNNNRLESFTAAPSGADVALSWTAASGTAGVLVARLDGGAQDAPEMGETYSVGDILPNGAEVVYVGADASSVDASGMVGRHSYMAWAFD